jgi:hypothetical protein
MVGSSPPPSDTAPPVQPLRLALVADKGSTDRCEGEGWVSFANNGNTDISLADFVLHDDIVTLLDASRAEVDTSGQLGDAGALNYVWTRSGSTWGYQVLGTLEPTPSPSPAPMVGSSPPPSDTPPPVQPLQLAMVADKGSTDRCEGDLIGEDDRIRF